jgi:serine/threonine protein kinase
MIAPMPDAAEDLDVLLDRQKSAWLAGSRPRIEELLTGSSLNADRQIVLDLLYNEIVLREEIGERPAVDEYVQHYPDLAEQLRLQFEVHAALHSGLFNDTRFVQNLKPVSLNDVLPDRGPDLPDYDILAPLGQGGMGVVYTARHRRLRRLVALKMFRPGRPPTGRELARFQTEAEAIARLQHPNIVQIFEVGQSDGLPFLALELAEGGTLAQRLQQLTYAPRDAAELVRTLALAVEHAHGHQIIHRDLKPANVVFTVQNTAKITDFGLAKVLEDADAGRDATHTGEPLGTPRYMAPEQAAGRPEQIGPATDVYALGTLLYECLTGQVPFVAPSTVATLDKIREEEPRPPRRLQPAIPRDLETICLKCLHKQPRRRYGSAQELADDLDRFLRREPIRARRTPRWERALMWCRRRPAQATLAAVAVAAVFASLLAIGVNLHLERQRLRKVREEVAGLVREGQEALDRQESEVAQERFLKALTLIRAEPSLRDQELGVLGWLHHSRRQVEPERWQQRRPPTPFDEQRDEALVQCLLLDARQPAAVAAARRSIQDALDLTVADDPAWDAEREQLALLDAGLTLQEGDAAGALAILDRTRGAESGVWHRRRADCLDRLGRKAEADEARRRADQLAPNGALAFFLSGVDRLHRGDVAGAVRDFDEVLTREPDHFMARLFQADCFLRENHLGEAKVALTACAAQRPRLAWTYLLRAQAHAQSNDIPAALADFQRGLELKPRDAARFALLANRGFLQLQREQWSLALADFDEALALRPDAADVSAARARAAETSESGRDQE